MHKFVKRREKLGQTLEDNSLVILFSGPEIKRSADAVYDYSVNRNFYYLTGIKQEGSLLLLHKKKGVVHETLFTTAYDPLKEVWTGRRLKPEDARAISGVKRVEKSEDFDHVLSDIIATMTSVGLDLEPGICTNDGALMAEWKQSHPFLKNLNLIDIYPTLIRMRMVKDDAEVLLIKDSIRLTATALKEATKDLKPGMFEYEVAAKFEYFIKKAHGNLGFSTIAASGKNAVILHYPDLNDRLEDGDLLLLDLGGHNNMYTADISRTFPVSSKTSPLQNTIYNIVLAANKAVIALIKPGLTLLDLQNFTKDFLKKELVFAGVMSENDDISKYYYHGVSHHLGLDTHDPGDRSLALEPGNVITVEPGLYLAEYGIGVRIEDNVLLTKDGNINLSSAIPKEFSDVVR